MSLGNLSNFVANRLLGTGQILIKTTGASIFLDSVIRESYSFPNVVVNNPITAGQDKTNHVYKQPAVFVYEGYISDYYILGGVSNNIVDTVFDLSSRSKSALKKLVQIRNSGELVEVNSSKFFFSSMLLENLTNIQVAETQSAVHLILTFKNVILSTVGSSAIPSDQQYGDAVDRGIQRLISA